jgi:hypothetical protein
LTSAHALAAAALFVALSGTAFAVSKESIKSKHVKNGTLSGLDVRDDSLTGADVDERSLRIDFPAPGNAGGPPSGRAGGALAGQYPSPSLAAGSVGAAQVKDDSLTAAELAPGSVGTAEVADDDLQAGDLATNSVGAAEIASSTVGGSEIASGAVDSVEVEDGSLNGDDVGRESGTVRDFNPPSLLPGICDDFQLDLGVPDDMRSDAFAVSMGDGWFEQFTVTAEAGDGPGRLELNVCNVSEFGLDQQPVNVHWVAFDV